MNRSVNGELNIGSNASERYARFNVSISKHEGLVSEWEYHSIVLKLLDWIERFNFEFKLKINTPCLAIDKKEKRVLGTYRYGFNGIGTKYEITINSVHLNRPLWDTLDTLLHELLHQWQDLHGKPGKGGYHNSEYRKKAAYLGITSDAWGHSQGVIKGGRFEELLKANSVCTRCMHSPKTHNGRDRTSTGKSKLKKWSCGCQNVWAGIAVLKARCENCGNSFVSSLK